MIYMKNIKIIIRTCPRDENIAKLCLYSFRKVGIVADYCFLADDGEYCDLKDIPVYYKPNSNNYGGQAGVKGLLNGLKQIELYDDDVVILSDSDIIVYNNFLSQIEDCAHLGVGGVDPNNGLFHISGQMQIFSGEIINRILSLSNDDIDDIVKHMCSNHINIADDTFNSYLTDLWNVKKKTIPNNWIHFKAYEYNNMDFEETINLVKKRFI